MPGPLHEPYGGLFEESRKADKVVSQIFSRDAMQDPSNTIREKAPDIENMGFAFWYTGMPSLYPEDLWVYRRNHVHTYIYFVLTGDCRGRVEDKRKSKRPTKYMAKDGVWHPLPPQID